MLIEAFLISLEAFRSVSFTILEIMARIHRRRFEEGLQRGQLPESYCFSEAGRSNDYLSVPGRKRRQSITPKVIKKETTI